MMNNSLATHLLISPISSASGEPLYRQIVDGIKREISEGRLLPHQPLPSFRALAEQLLVSLITVKRAYEELERDGIIYCKQGLGTFVSARGDQRSREAKQQHAARLMQQAIAEACESGLDRQEISKLFKQALREHFQEVRA